MFVFVKLVQLKGLVTAYYPDFYICIFCVCLCLCNDICIRICLCSTLIFAFAFVIHTLHTFAICNCTCIGINICICIFIFKAGAGLRGPGGLLPILLLPYNGPSANNPATKQNNTNKHKHYNTNIQRMITNTSEYTQTNINSYKYCRDHIKK